MFKGVITMEMIKDITSIVGCISAVLALITTIVKPIRQKFIDWLTHKNTMSGLANDVKKIKEGQVQSLENDKKLDKRMDIIETRINTLETRVLDNEADRLKAEIFNCGNRCRRGIFLYPEEFDHIRLVHHKYSDELHCNSDGTAEWNFIYNYYNEQQMHMQQND